ncbi:hypothetical protein Vadar_008993 [Vaccinium darrowii]|uniref:Uncharacterized protein n=1 Tax=Vaccinium darrowii TaxID=229202 RepID=A0ACB7WZB0_9ERIC|nr:hypothetical protein Vadar_008993 [Vaccinium darrowii]
MSLRFAELVKAPQINMLVVLGELNWEGVRLYSECDFELMSPHQEPEIRRVHLGVAILRIILALGTTGLWSFDFIDASNAIAMDMAIRNLIQLGVVLMKNDVLELTKDGLKLVRLDIEPWLGKIILECFEHCLGKEGLVQMPIAYFAEWAMKKISLK